MFGYKLLQLGRNNDMHFRPSIMSAASLSRSCQPQLKTHFANAVLCAQSCAAGASTPTWFAAATVHHGRRLSTDSGVDPLKAGMFGVVRSLLRALEHGTAGKALLDCVIDACSAMQNLREAIGVYRSRWVRALHCGLMVADSGTWCYSQGVYAMC